MIHDIYRTIVPIGIRYFIARIRGIKYNKQKLKELKEQFEAGKYDDVYRRELKYIVEHNKIVVFPYEWIEKYENIKIEIFREKSNKMKYVMHKGKKLFFPRGYSNSFIEKYYLSLIVEQDIRSPHCYFGDDLEKVRDCIFVDVGAAEGIISLEVVDLAKKIVLFECNEAWKQALKATFAPWSEKVEIVSKFVGEQSIKEKRIIKLDDWFRDNAQISKDCIVVKLDVEGNEKNVLKGARKLLNSCVKSVYACTYHKQEDFQVLSRMLKTYLYEVEVTEGYMFYGERGKEGFRKGLIRAFREEAGNEIDESSFDRG